MRLHLHRAWTPWRETLTSSPVVRHEQDEQGRPTSRVERVRVTIARRRCLECGLVQVVTEREGRRWRRTIAPPASWTPPTDPAAYWDGPEGDA